MTRATERENPMFVLLRQHERTLRTIWRKKEDVSKAEQSQRRAHRKHIKEAKKYVIIFVFCFLSLWWSHINLKPTAAISVRVWRTYKQFLLRLPLLQASPASASQAPVPAGLNVILWRNIALRGSDLRFKFLTKEYDLPGHRSAVLFSGENTHTYRHTWLCVIHSASF